MSGTASSLRARAALLLRREGPVALAKGVLRYIRVQGRRVAHAGDFYVYRYPIPCLDPEDNRPRVDNLDVRIIDSLHDILLLADAGYEDPRMRMPPMEKRLAAGAAAVCGFANRRLAYVGWMAMSPWR